MNIIFALLTATTLIAGFILLRMFADRCALQARLRRALTDSECEQAGCFRGCEPNVAAAKRNAGTGTNESNRSESHAH